MSGGPTVFEKAGGSVEFGKVYIPRKADALLPALLQRGEICLVLGPRQMGKSSLRLRVSRELLERGRRVCTLELQRLVSRETTREDLFEGLARGITRELGLPSHLWKEDSRPLYERWTTFLEAILEQADAQTVIFMDEIDKILSAEQGNLRGDDLFSSIRYIRELQVARGRPGWLTFCLIGCARRADLLSDPLATSFNVGEDVRLEDFRREELFPAEEALVGCCEDPREVVDRVYDWTAGHPYMTANVCAALQERPASTDPAEFLVEYVERQFIRPVARGEDRSVTDMRARFDGALRRFPAVEAVYRSALLFERVPYKPQNPVHEEVYLTGMVRIAAHSGDNSLVIRNRIVARVFDQAWLEARSGRRPWQEQIGRWVASQHRDALLRGAELAEYKAWADGRPDLMEQERSFLVASQEAEIVRQAALARRERREKYFAIGAVVVLAGLGGLALWLSIREAQARRELARQNGLLEYANTELEALNREIEQQRAEADERSVTLAEVNAALDEEKRRAQQAASAEAVARRDAEVFAAEAFAAASNERIARQDAERAALGERQARLDAIRAAEGEAAARAAETRLRQLAEVSSQLSVKERRMINLQLAAGLAREECEMSGRLTSELGTVLGGTLNALRGTVYYLGDEKPPLLSVLDLAKGRLPTPSPSGLTVLSRWTEDRLRVRSDRDPPVDLLLEAPQRWGRAAFDTTGRFLAVMVDSELRIIDTWYGDDPITLPGGFTDLLGFTLDGSGLALSARIEGSGPDPKDLLVILGSPQAQRSWQVPAPPSSGFLVPADDERFRVGMTDGRLLSVPIEGGPLFQAESPGTHLPERPECASEMRPQTSATRGSAGTLSTGQDTSTRPTVRCASPSGRWTAIGRSTGTIQIMPSGASAEDASPLEVVEVTNAVQDLYWRSDEMLYALTDSGTVREYLLTPPAMVARACNWLKYTPLDPTLTKVRSEDVARTCDTPFPTCSFLPSTQASK